MNEVGKLPGAACQLSQASPNGRAAAPGAAGVAHAVHASQLVHRLPIEHEQAIERCAEPGKIISAGGMLQCEEAIGAPPAT